MKISNYKLCLIVYSWSFLLVGLSVYYSLRGAISAGIILPIYSYLKYVDKTSPTSYLLLSGRHSITGLAWGLLLGFIITGTTAFTASFYSGSLYLIWPWEDLANIVIIASLVEEILFRGFLLQKLLEVLPFYNATIITSLLFTVIHFPTWFCNGVNGADIYIEAAYIFVFSTLLSFVFYRTKSLWTSIILHAANNYSALAALGLAYTSPYL